jgi:2-polyprenyl-6-methoxyphenol hydroxylase-like FAD-dependent oxidoreductase
MTKHHAVVIVGGGPTGLMLAAELALARIDVAIVERRLAQDLPGSRAGGLTSRTIEVLDQRGVADRFLAEGKRIPVAAFVMAPLSLVDLPSRHNYWLGLFQEKIERILAAWVGELGVPTYRGREVTSFAQDDAGVDATLSDGTRLRADYLVGCDGGRSRIRKQAGIEFAGWDPSFSALIAEASMSNGDAGFGIRHADKGVLALGKLDDGDGRVRMVMTEKEIRRGEEPTVDDLRAVLVEQYGSDLGLHDVTWLSRFTDTTLQATTYRNKRVLVAGDAAHIHSPAGGQGLNMGVQDAVNLGWKLAQVVRGTSADALLDTYQTERHAVGAKILKTTMALTALNRGDERTKALRELVGTLIQLDQARRFYTTTISGLDVHYDLGEGNPLLGRRMPDLEVLTSDGPNRVFALLHEARPLLLVLGDRERTSQATSSALDLGAWADRVKCVDVRYDGAWEVPLVGAAAAPSAVLIRPDGHVAWVGDGSDAGLRDALSAWFGAAAT